jgi:predicted Zn-dependent protease with MMP-like domain
MSPSERERFDALVEEAIEALPPALQELIEELPIVVEDHPSRDMAEKLLQEWAATGGDADPDDSPERLMEELCGLHDARSYLEESVEQPPDAPGMIMLFRDGILAQAGGWDNEHGDDAVYEEITITLLHEIGHQFGLEEDDLENLGYA